MVVQTATRMLLGARRRRVAAKRKQKFGWLREIRVEQARTGFQIPRKPFQRLVRQLAHDYFVRPGMTMRFARDAMDALQTAAEARLTKVLENAYLITTTACKKHPRVEIMPEDIQLARRIMGLQAE